VTAGIESEHLVEVFDIGIDEDTQSPFLVMELLRGEDLGARLERGERTRPAELVSIFEQVARALDKTHEAGVIHRDLKPENLFVTRRDDGSLKMRILDFGIAKLMEGRGAKKSTRSVGTPLYMAPEQMTGDAEELGPAADVYALGHIAFTLLVGSAYFEPEARTAPSALGLMAKVCSGAVDPASKRAAALGLELSPKLDAWFARATALQPGQALCDGRRAVLSPARRARGGARGAGSYLRRLAPGGVRGDATGRRCEPGRLDLLERRGGEVGGGVPAALTADDH
jgi:serine/threonine protein kinase